MKLSADHQFVKRVSARSVLWNLTKGGKNVSIKEIQAALKEAGLQYNKEYIASKQFRNRVYWFDVEVQELGFETDQTIDEDTKQIVAIRLVKKEKPTKKAKKEKPLAKSAKKPAKKKQTKKVESESESAPASESESAADESEE